MKTKEIRDLIDFISQSGLNEVHIETEELKLSVKRDAEQVAAPVVERVVSAAPAAAPAPAAVSATAPEAASEKPAAASSKHAEIKSPMIGTFYRSSSPETDPFVAVGDRVEKGQTVCIIEAMKLFNEIEADISGTVVKILVDDATPIEYDQPLFLIDPS